MLAIPNIEKPKNCKACPFTCEKLAFFDGENRPKGCPLIEIVTCGECKYAKFKIEDAEYVKCKITQLFVNKSDFCSYGERETEDFNPYQGERDRDENGEIY